MTHIELRQHFDAPIEHVFDLVIEYKRYPEWSTYFTEVKEVKGLPDRVGTEIVGTVALLGRKFEGTTKIVEIEKPRMITFSGTGLQGGIVKSTYRFTPVTSGTDVVVETEYELPSAILTLFDKLFVEKAVERELRHSLENFKAFVELKTPLLV
jgi:uncharacterized membrane protein